MKKKQIMIIAVVLIGASVIAWMTEPQKPENEQKADVIADQDTQNVDADEKETEKQTTATEENRSEDTEENTEAETDARALQCMEEYLADKEEQGGYFALKDVDADGSEELLYRYDEMGISHLTVLDYIEGQLYGALDLEYAENTSAITLCNETDLTLIETISDTKAVSYYTMRGLEHDQKTISMETVYEEDISYNYFIDGEACSKEQFDYYNVNASDWLNYNGRYPEERYIKSVEKLVFHENTEAARKSVFEDQINFSGYDMAVLKNLIGIIGYMEGEGKYTTGTETLPQEWSDEAKLEFMDDLIASNLIEDDIVISYVDDEHVKEVEWQLLPYDNEEINAVDHSYFAIREDDMNQILENVLGVRVDSQINTEFAIYDNGYYIFRTGQFVDWIPYAEIYDEPVLSADLKSGMVYAETGIGVFDYDENTKIPGTIEGDDVRYFKDVYLQKNKESVCAAVKITGWSEDEVFEQPY